MQEKINEVLNKYTTEYSWEESGNMFVGEVFTIIPLKNTYRIMVADNLLCFQCVVDMDVLDLYFNDNEPDVATKLDELIGKYETGVIE